jgi:hypothetical protein
MKKLATILFVFIATTLMGFKSHPFYVTVTEVEHNAATKTVEVSIKIFTDDFEKTLRKNYKTKIDLLNSNLHAAMDAYVKDYTSKRFALQINGQPITLNYIGYEQIEEGIFCYFEAQKVSAVKTIKVKNGLLFDYTTKQTSVVHCKVNGTTQSAKNNHPKQDFEFSW